MPYRIYISREFHTPPIPDPEKRRMVRDILVDNGNEWTHFTYLHSRNIAKYVLLYKRDNREIFHYKSRRLYPLPWFDDYIVFRDYKPEQLGYSNIYYHIKSGGITHLNSHTHEAEDGSIVSAGEYVFELPFYWRYFSRLFLWVFKKRMRGLIDEDNVLINERIRMKGMDNRACRPHIPETYDMFNALYGDKGLPEADVRFLDRTIYHGLELD